jgi:SPOR domain
MTQGAAEDLWHLSIDDLFVTPVETPPLEGPGPFVINLSASTAPISIPATGLAGFEKLKLYQFSRKEDGRDRFRLRLGFFESPAAANEALAALRESYPSAFATNATEDDQRFNPARPRPPRAEPVIAPAVQNSSAHAHARSAVRHDAGRRGKKKDIRCDHAAYPRGTEEHAHRNKPAPRHGHVSTKSAPLPAQQTAVKEESIDVGAILLAALAPPTPAKPQLAPSKPQPQNNVRHGAKPGHGPKHSRPHAKPSEPKHPASRSGASAPAVVAPPAASPAASQPGVPATPEIPTPTPVPAPERPPADVDNEANIVTHPRLVEAPAANSEVADADMPIDLRFIDRIFDDNTPTVEVLALDLPPEQERKDVVEPIAAKAEPAKEVAPEPKPIAKQPPKEPETHAISAHDIIALLTQPIPAARASRAMPEIEPEPRPVEATAMGIEGEIPTLTQVVEAESPPSAPMPVQAEEVTSAALPAQTEAGADSSVGSIAAGIESELELILPAQVPTADEAPAASAGHAVKADEAPSAPPIELELELVPDVPSVPAPSEVFEDVVVAQAIPPRREPLPVAKRHTDAPVAASVRQAAPVRRVPASVPGARLPADSIFKVKNRPMQARTAAPAKPAAPPVKRPVVIFDAPIEDMDSTQTLRALTPLELNDDSQSKWFAVQLALSEDPVKIESLPHIDIFDEYRLYSISGIDQGRFVHSLRMGFFSAESSAQAVAGYLRASFGDAEVKRVSIAEHDRFAERKTKPEKKSESEALAERASEPKSVAAQPASASLRTARPRGNGSAPKAAHRSGGSVDSSPTGRHKTLGEQLYDEARQVAVSQSAIRRIPKNSSLWSRLFGQDKDKR